MKMACDALDLIADHRAAHCSILDSTTSYVNGKMPALGGMIQAESGALPSTTVLVGAFLISTGAPICGVVGQPFSTHTDDVWTSRLFWGTVGGDGGHNRSSGIFPAASKVRVNSYLSPHRACTTPHLMDCPDTCRRTYCMSLRVS